MQQWCAHFNSINCMCSLWHLFFIYEIIIVNCKLQTRLDMHVILYLYSEKQKPNKKPKEMDQWLIFHVKRTKIPFVYSYSELKSSYPLPVGCWPVYRFAFVCPLALVVLSFLLICCVNNITF